MARRKKRTGQSRGDQRQERMHALVRLRYLENKTIKDCALKLGVSTRTIDKYLADDDFKTLASSMREEWKEAAITNVAEMQSLVMKTMRDVMTTSTSDKARVEAAKTVGEWMGLAAMAEAGQKDDRGELERVLRVIAEQRPHVQVNNPVFLQPVREGGLLPAEISRDVSLSDFMSGKMSLGAPKVVEADPTADWMQK